MPAWLSIRSIADIEALEETPIEDRGWDKTVYELVLGGAALDPGKAAFLNLPTGNPMEEAVPTSYGAFLTQVHQAANLFNSLGVGKNDVVAIMLPIVPENFVAMIGAATAGILCPVNWMLERSQISAILDAVEAKVLVAQAPADGYDIWEKAARLGDQVDSLAHILQVALPGYPAEPERDFAALLRDHQGARLNFTPPATPDDTAIFAHTGGTTGMPKIARLRHRAIAYKCWAYSVLLETKPEHVQFAGSPLRIMNNNMR